MNKDEKKDFIKWSVSDVTMEGNSISQYSPRISASIQGRFMRWDNTLNDPVIRGDYIYADLHNKLCTLSERYSIKRVIFNPPATVIFWDDGTKSVVKCQEGDTYNPETGFALAYLKKLLGNDNTFNKEIDKWVPQFDGVVFDMKQAEKDMHIKQAYNALDLYVHNGANKLTKTQMAGIIEQAVDHLMGALDFPEANK